jgi:hypothetical protein
MKWGRYQPTSGHISCPQTQLGNKELEPRPYMQINHIVKRQFDALQQDPIRFYYQNIALLNYIGMTTLEKTHARLRLCHAKLAAEKYI